MCDERTEKEGTAWLAGQGGVSRRQFGALAGSAALAMTMPANAEGSGALREEHVTITTPDGEADCYFVAPAETKSPGFLMWTDIRGLRPAFEIMGKRLARAGYAVLVPNPFYRSAKAPVVTPEDDFSDPALREKLFGMARMLSAETVATDTKVFTDFLDQSGAVDTGKRMGVSGYCMGGSMAFRTATTLPERYGAVASFHGGRLVTDGEDSPHLHVGETTADYLVAIAANDHERAPGDKDALIKAFADAGLKAEVEVYADAMHGWCPPDSRVYHQPQAEKAWSRLLDLLEAL